MEIYLVHREIKYWFLKFVMLLLKVDKEVRVHKGQPRPSYAGELHFESCYFHVTLWVKVLRLIKHTSFSLCSSSKKNNFSGETVAFITDREVIIELMLCSILGLTCVVVCGLTCMADK
jgi:hypothetical protein